MASHVGALPHLQRHRLRLPALSGREEGDCAWLGDVAALRVVGKAPTSSVGPVGMEPALTILRYGLGVTEPKAGAVARSAHTAFAMIASKRGIEKAPHDSH